MKSGCNVGDSPQMGVPKMGVPKIQKPKIQKKFLTFEARLVLAENSQDGYRQH